MKRCGEGKIQNQRRKERIKGGRMIQVEGKHLKSIRENKTRNKEKRGKGIRERIKSRKKV